MLTPALELACRAAIIGVFGLAVVGKLRNRAAFDRFSAALSDLRLVTTRRRPVAAVVVLSEIAVIVLLSAPIRHLGFLVAGAVSAALAAGLMIARRRGSEAPCHCFGINDETERPTVARPVVLLALAGSGLAAGLVANPSEPDVGMAGTAVLFGLTLAWLIRRGFVSRSKVPALGPDRELLAMRGRRLPAELNGTGPAGGTLLVMLSTGCPGCRDAAAELPYAWGSGIDPTATVLVISGDQEAAQEMAATVGEGPTIIIEPSYGPLTRAVDPVGMPLFVRADGDGVIVAASLSLTEMTGVLPRAAGR